MSRPVLTTPFTELLGIERPISLAGMNQASGPLLCAAVTNAGGIGVIGGVGYTPDYLRKQIKELKSYLKNKNAPFGVDLLLPAVGGNARKTNYDYTGGNLKALVRVIIEEKAALFVCAVGVPPKEVVDELHKAKIPVMNMVGSPKHVPKALAVGVDLICAQGGEAGGHTGSTPTMLLIPACVELCKGKKSPLTGQPVQVIAAGGIHNGAGLAASLALGATGVWVGTRFVNSEEAGASEAHQKAVMSAGYDDTVRTIIFTGRPCRVRRTPFIDDWENNKQDRIKELTSKGTIPVGLEDADNRPVSLQIVGALAETSQYFMGQTAGAINDILPAATIMDRMISNAVAILKKNSAYIQGGSKL